MTAKIIVFANEKGGTGKSTLAMHVIVGLLRMGKKVASFDFDYPQGTLTHYIENRNMFAKSMGVPLPTPIHTAWDEEKARIYTPRGQIDKIRTDVDVIVIDTPGSTNQLAQEAMVMADVLITPINDSLVDLDVLAQVDTNTLKIKGPSHFAQVVWSTRQQRMIERKNPMEWFVVRNRLTYSKSKNAQLMTVLLNALSRRIHYTLSGGISERVIYRELFLKGLTMMDLKENGLNMPSSVSANTAKQEVIALLQNIFHQDDSQKAA